MAKIIKSTQLSTFVWYLIKKDSLRLCLGVTAEIACTEQSRSVIPEKGI